MYTIDSFTRILRVAGALIVLLLYCFALDPGAQAVTPAPDGGYPGGNTAEGTQALQSLTTGIDNTAVGQQALFSDTTGSYNNALGFRALYSNTIGPFNVAIGVTALYNNTSGQRNIASGYGALFKNKTGTGNVALGSTSLYNLLASNGNTATGDNTLYNNTAGFNVANGSNALFKNTIGVGNVGVGAKALYNNTTGSGNIALGEGSGVNLTVGNDNIDIGNDGVAGESGIIRLGTAGTHTKTFLNGKVIVGISGAIDTTNFTGLSLQYTSGSGEGAIMSSFDDGFGFLSFYTKAGSGQPITRRMTIEKNGNVGIGTSTPGFPLSFPDVLGNKISLWGQSGNSYGFGIQGALLQIHSDVIGSDIAFGFGSSAAFTETMRIKGNGRVGIGTNNPTQAFLVVNSSVTNAQNAGRYFDSTTNALTDLAGAGHSTYSIFASNRIAAQSFDAISDARIKRIEGRSDAVGDLNTLMKIEVTNYKFKDTIAQGNVPQKKIIGQQVEQVYPQAVSQHTDVVPDIYAKATLKDGWVQLASDLKVGERVRLIGEKDEGIYEVLEVREGAFRTAFQSATERVFVYGREVKDFRTVDYGAITMLNVSATQEIKKEKDAEIAGLKAENKQLQKEMQTVLGRLKEQEAKIQKVSAQVELGKATPKTVANN